MTEWLTHTTKNGATVKVWTDAEDIAKAAFNFYDSILSNSVVFKCPYCQNADGWDHVHDVVDGETYEDCYGCDVCDTLITICTPVSNKEYWRDFPAETTYLIEFLFALAPSTWPDCDLQSSDFHK